MVGSFLNVVIYRLPRNESVITPRSKCPQCSSMVKWYQNIPIISFLILKGKCANCDFKIPWRYPLTELTVALFSLLLMPVDLSPQALFNYAFFFSVACVFLAHLLIDLEHQLLPDKLNIYLLLVSIPYVVLHFPLMHWLLGALIGFFGPYGVTALFYKLRGVVGLGGGDIKLFGILGFILGPLGIINNIFMSCMIGSIIGVILIALKKLDRNAPFAFGPFIILAATLQIFFPDIVELINPLYIK
ncbi:MAG: prepilin peptidase [Halobacteriovoraceae bacterium]|nr:prepilin peptidase [Halobacteriovoraceae bacterium]